MTDHDVDSVAIAHAVASCAASHTTLVAELRALADVDPTAPSALPDWTIGHVLTHIARNGDSILDLLAGRPQYPSVESRNADIEAGAGRSWGVLIDDVASTAAAVDDAFESHSDWSGVARTMRGDRPHGDVPLLRQREVEVHRVDLGLGYGFGQMPADYVRRDLGAMEMMWSERKPTGPDSLPEAALASDQPTRLSWLMGRTDIRGLEPAGVF